MVKVIPSAFFVVGVFVVGVFVGLNITGLRDDKRERVPVDMVPTGINARGEPSGFAYPGELIECEAGYVCAQYLSDRGCPAMFWTVLSKDTNGDFHVVCKSDIRQNFDASNPYPSSVRRRKVE